MLRITFVLGICLVACFGAPQDDSGRILNGKKAEKLKYPFQVSIQEKKMGKNIFLTSTIRVWIRSLLFAGLKVSEGYNRQCRYRCRARSESVVECEAVNHCRVRTVG